MRIPISKSAVLEVASAFILLLWQVPCRAGGISLNTEYIVGQYGTGAGSGQNTLTAFGPGAPQVSLSDGLALGLVDAEVAASGGLYGPYNDLRLGTYTAGHANSYYNSNADQVLSIFQAWATAHWDDRFTVSGQAGIPFPSSVTMVVNVDGLLSGGAHSRAQVGDFGSGNTAEILDASGSLTLALRLDSNGQGRFFLDLESSASGAADLNSDLMPQHVAGISDFSHTLRIGSILMADAGGMMVTPESLGYSLSFDSGMRSPNLLSVPEPSSFVMLASGAVVLLGYGWRRRQRTSARPRGIGLGVILSPLQATATYHGRESNDYHYRSNAQ